jgi:two-component system, chemotaxis family, protein-glutamate methylesterase/glutaminase
MAFQKLVVAGASAGGLSALQSLVRGLPKKLEASLLISLHMAADSRSALAEILQKESSLEVKRAADGDRLESGVIYVCVPDRHLTIEKGHARVWFGPKDNNHRPSIDHLFRSAAWYGGKGTCGIILSGFLSDGAAGLRAIKERGGLALVQDPVEANSADMPLNALKLIDVDFALAAEQMGNVIRRWAAGDLRPRSPQAAAFEREKDETKRTFSCPACDGVLRELPDGKVPRLECLVGHSFSWEGFATEQKNGLERALWTAARSLTERAVIATRLMTEAKKRKSAAAPIFRRRAAELKRDADIIKKMIGR